MSENWNDPEFWEAIGNAQDSSDKEYAIKRHQLN